MRERAAAYCLMLIFVDYDRYLPLIILYYNYLDKYIKQPINYITVYASFQQQTTTVSI